MMSKRLQVIFMGMVTACLAAIIYKEYNISSKHNLLDLALTGIEKFQSVLNEELDK